MDLKVLIEKGAYIEARNVYNDTPLYLAALQGRTGTVQYLIDSGNTHERAIVYKFSVKIYIDHNYLYKWVTELLFTTAVLGLDGCTSMGECL